MLEKERANNTAVAIPRAKGFRLDLSSLNPSRRELDLDRDIDLDIDIDLDLDLDLSSLNPDGKRGRARLVPQAALFNATEHILMTAQHERDRCHHHDHE